MLKGELTAEWWKWFYSSKEEPHLPLFLKDVIFLATKEMTPYDSKTLEIKDSIPPNIPILFPVDKWISLGFPFTPDEELRKVAVQRLEDLTMSVSLNGEQVRTEQIMSPIFYLDLKREMLNPELGTKVKKGKYKAISNGHWLYTVLKDTKNEIKSYACCKTGRLTLAVNHLCQVKI